MPKKSNVTSTHQRDRSVTPIKGTIEHVPGYPKKLIIFKVGSSPYWWTRSYHKGRHVKRSTATTIKRQAIQFAKDFYNHLLTGQPVGQVKNVVSQLVGSFQRCLNGLQEEDLQRAERGEISRRYAKEQRSLMDRHIRAELGGYEIGEINYGILDNFLTFLFKLGLANNTIRLYFVAINRIFVYGQKHGYLTTAPVKPSIKIEDNPRGWFDLKDYKLIRRAARRFLNYVWEEKQLVSLADEEPKYKLIRRIIMTADTQWMIPFMVYSFIRPSDLKNIRHCHVEIRDGEEGEYLYLPIPTSKKHNKPIVSMPRAVAAYRKLLEWHKQQGFGSQNDFVFMPAYSNRDTAYRHLARAFGMLLEETGTKEGRDDEARSIYSLRHTSIMFRLIYGGEINTIKLARNARTSVDVIERFYASQLEPSHVTRDLHAKKPRKARKPTKTIIAAARPATEQDFIELIKEASSKVDDKRKLIFSKGKIVVSSDLTD